MGLRQMSLEQQSSLYSTLTADERARMHPFTVARCVLMGGDSAHHEPISFDLPDDARSDHNICLTSKRKLDEDKIGENIEEVAMIERKKLPSPEPQPQIEKKNGFDNNGKTFDKSDSNDAEDDACINCIYVTQQICACVIM